MRRIKLTIAYDGADFAGWQYQPNVRTIQGELEEAIKKILQHSTRVVAAGRTDAGVHAVGQVVHFKSYTHLSCETIKKALNAVLSPSIRIRKAKDVPRSFHARFSAQSRIYKYFISHSSLPFLSRYCWIIDKELDLELMHEALKKFEGEHDFASFGSAVSPGGSTVRNVIQANIKRKSGLIIITIEANAFLKKMVRFLVGAAVKAAMEKLSIEEIEKALFYPELYHCPVKPAPAHGLFLWKVKYKK